LKEKGVIGLGRGKIYTSKDEEEEEEGRIIEKVELLRLSTGVNPIKEF
jgi:hypothetical protein